MTHTPGRFECAEQQELRRLALESVRVLRDGQELCWRLDFGADGLGAAGVIRQDSAATVANRVPWADFAETPRYYGIWFEWPRDAGFAPGRQVGWYESVDMTVAALDALLASLRALIVED